MYYMAYFRDKIPEIFLACSEDLLHWEDMYQGKSVFNLNGSKQIVRDPFLLRDKDNVWHIFYTNNWYSDTIGHCTSEDLQNFTKQEDIRLFDDTTKDVYNCWAPELFWNEEEKTYCMIWSTSFRSQNSEHEDSNRIWCAKSQDLYHFSEPEIFFDPGYPVIDASVLKKDNIYYMAFKDERLFNAVGSPYSALRTATSENAYGTYENISPILTEWRSEGPMLLYEDGEYYIFYDSFGTGKYGAIKSKDFIHWENISSKITIPEGCRHMSIYKA